MRADSAAHRAPRPPGTVDNPPPRGDTSSAPRAGTQDPHAALQSLLREFRDAQPAGPHPELLAAPEAARLCGVSEATWWRLHAAARVPAPVRLGRRTLWRLRELREFIASGCPN